MAGEVDGQCESDTLLVVLFFTGALIVGTGDMHCDPTGVDAALCTTGELVRLDDMAALCMTGELVRLDDIPTCGFAPKDVQAASL